MSRRFALALMGLLLVSCARPQQSTFRPISVLDADAAFRELSRIQHNFPGMQSYARLRASSGERRQSFNARISVDSSGRARIDGLTPIGTAAITIWSDGRNVIYLDHINNIFWQGPAGALSGPLRVIAERGAFLLAGLPVDDPAITYRTEPTGLAEANVGDVRFSFQPPQFPPTRVVIESGSDRIEIEHADLSSGSEPLSPPAIASGYRQGSTPTLVPRPRVN